VLFRSRKCRVRSSRFCFRTRSGTPEAAPAPAALWQTCDAEELRATSQTSESRVFCSLNVERADVEYEETSLGAASKWVVLSTNVVVYGCRYAVFVVGP
jgi:hypothetical protein